MLYNWLLLWLWRLFLLICSPPYLCSFPYILILSIASLVSVGFQPLWLKEAEAAELFFCQVWIIPFISHEGEYQDEGRYYPLSLPITTVLSQSASSLPFSLVSFFFLCYCRHASACTCMPWGMPARTEGFHCPESEK